MSNYKQEKQIQQSITDSINKILSEAVVNGFVPPVINSGNNFGYQQSTFKNMDGTPISAPNINNKNKTKETFNKFFKAPLKSGNNFGYQQSTFKNMDGTAISAPTSQTGKSNVDNDTEDVDVTDLVTAHNNRVAANSMNPSSPNFVGPPAPGKKTRDTIGNNVWGNPVVNGVEGDSPFNNKTVPFTPDFSGDAPPNLNLSSSENKTQPAASSVAGLGYGASIRTPKPSSTSKNQQTAMRGDEDQGSSETNKMTTPNYPDQAQHQDMFAGSGRPADTASTLDQENNPNFVGPPSSLADPEKQADFVGPPSSLSNAKYIPSDKDQGSSETKDAGQKSPENTGASIVNKQNPIGTPNTSGTAIRSPFVAKPQVNTPATNPGFMLSPQGAPASRPSQTGDFKVTPANPNTPATNPGFMVSPQGAPSLKPSGQPPQSTKPSTADTASMKEKASKPSQDVTITGIAQNQNDLDKLRAMGKQGTPNENGNDKFGNTPAAQKLAQSQFDAWELSHPNHPLVIAKKQREAVSEPKPMSASDRVGALFNPNNSVDNTRHPQSSDGSWTNSSGERVNNGPGGRDSSGKRNMQYGESKTRADFDAERNAAEEKAYPGSTKGRPARGEGSNVGLSSSSFGFSSGSGPAKPLIPKQKQDETAKDYQARVNDVATNFETQRDANRRINSHPVYSQDGNVTDSYTGENIGTQNTTGSNVTSNNSRSRNNRGGRGGVGGALKENFNAALPSTRNNYYNKNINKLGSLGIPVNEGMGMDFAKGAADVALIPWGQAVPYALGAMGEIGFDQANVNAQNAHWGNIGGAAAKLLLNKLPAKIGKNSVVINTLADNIAKGSNTITQIGFDPRAQAKQKINLETEEPKSAAKTTTTPAATTPTATTPTAPAATTPKPPKTSTPTPGGTPTGRKPGSASTWALNRSQIHNVKPGIALT